MNYFRDIIVRNNYLDIISPNNDFKDKLMDLFAAFPEIDLRAMGFNANWQSEPLWATTVTAKKSCFQKLLEKFKKYDESPHHA